ncbi:hypothetical protein EYZ11_008193 [Aspergillus tanneri]|uniref:Uncharacterized protein n=1 Tax=Aspergillus tanneri TaxID=1220188 RepID=A0A4S3JB37_9EURO|nr:hypothetical protein EYZ11_008193 [Aspergillus tanneri]
MQDPTIAIYPYMSMYRGPLLDDKFGPSPGPVAA